MSVATLIRRMAEAGAPAEAIALAVEAIEAAQAQIEAGRTAARDRKRRQRERNVTVTGQSRDMDVTVTPHPPSLPSSPQTPQQPTHPPGEILPARKGPSKADVAEGFLAFWSAYPRRVGKDAAAKAFSKALARIDDPDPLAVILAGIERALPGWDDPRFIPHPSTWLNEGRWSDDAPEIRTESRPRHDRPDPRTAKSDHLAAVRRAMEAACDRDEGEH